MRIPQEFHAPRTRDEKIDHTIHDYVDGVLSRRSLVCRLTLLAGGAAAAMTLLESEGLAQVSQQTCPSGTYPSGQDTIMAHLAHPLAKRDAQPAVLVLSENRGLTDQIRDVTRRVAKAGYVALGVDLLSRQVGPESSLMTKRRFRPTARRFLMNACGTSAPGWSI